MLKLNPSQQAEKFLSDLPQGNPKHARQLGQKRQALLENPNLPDAKPLKGEPVGYWRFDAGEYRLIYRIEGNVLKLVYYTDKHVPQDLAMAHTGLVQTADQGDTEAAVIEERLRVERIEDEARRERGLIPILIGFALFKIL